MLGSFAVATTISVLIALSNASSTSVMLSNASQSLICSRFCGGT